MSWEGGFRLHGESHRCLRGAFTAVFSGHLPTTASTTLIASFCSTHESPALHRITTRGSGLSAGLAKPLNLSHLDSKVPLTSLQEQTPP